MRPIVSAIRSVLLASALCFPAFSATAQSTYVDIEKRLTAEQLRETGLNTLTPAQLARLNALLREDGAQAEAKAEAVKAEAVAVAVAKREVREEGDGKGHLIGLSEGPIRARAVGDITGWEPGTVFTLDNGQQWKVLKGAFKLPRTLASPQVVLVPGVAGRWFFQVDEDTPRPRVYRID